MLEKNKRAEVVYLQPRSQTLYRQLVAMGVLPKVELVLLQRSPSYVFKVGKSQFAVDVELASSIYVKIV
jgi:DtxR family Mn-dependent transcriptional regulator